MTLELILTIAALIGILFFLLAIGLEVGWSVGIVALVGMVFVTHQPVTRLAITSWGVLNSFIMTAVPLFILMGALLEASGVADRLFLGLERWIGRFPGGMLTTIIAGNALFGAMSGSSIAAVATFGKTAFPVAEKRGYQPSLTLGSIAAGGMLAPLIPPSILLIIYGGWTGTSVVALLAAGLIPGLTLGILFVVYLVIRVKLNPALTPPPSGATWKERAAALRGIAPSLVIIVGVLGVIFGGIMTPTEAASLGAFLSLLLCLAYRRLNMTTLRESLLETVRVTSMAMFIMAMATSLTYVLNITGISQRVTEYVVALPLGKIGILVLFYLMYLVMGCFFDTWSMLFLTFPFVMPVINALGINPIWWGVVYVLAGEQAVITPPFGLHLFILHNLFPQYSIGTIVRGSLPFLIPLYANVALLMAFPQLALWLPSLLGK
ncbi:MAG: TRAP transporter large permease subunit [Chloroflexi bacterium]|nr:TRAP transporter large permease subunit [Chloroflexota bacterium]